MKNRLVLPQIVCLLFVLGRGTGRADAPAVEVTVAVPVQREVVDYLELAGRTAASQEVWIRARVSGYLVRSFFGDGSKVKKGDLLFEIDPRPYLAELDKAKAEARRCEVRLRTASAALSLANKRRATNAVSEEELGRARGDQEEAEAALAAAKANVSIAMLNVDFTHVTSPIDGRTGRALIDVGNVVKSDESQLTTIVNRDPAFVYFDVDERTMLRLYRLLRRGGVKVAERRLPVYVGLADEDGFPHEGVIDFVDNRVDPDRATIKFRAILPNPNGLLSPGLFARIRLPQSEPRKSLLLVERAIHKDGGGKYVYVVDDKYRAFYRRVTVGAAQADGLRVIEEGLDPEDRVVISGLTGARPVVPVKPRPGEMMTTPSGDR